MDPIQTIAGDHMRDCTGGCDHDPEECPQARLEQARRHLGDEATSHHKWIEWEGVAEQARREIARRSGAGPSLACVEVMPDGSAPVRLSFSIKVF